jgi:NADPH:quinone reductase-like Zn-dependent oxidoreductase
MKAFVYREYGTPDVLRIEDVPKPTPGDDDYHLMSGVYIMRPMTGLRRPKPTSPGVDMAGEVEAVGRNVTRFRTGDAVFGAARHSFAEYVCAAENRLAAKPANLTFEQAAAIPVAGLTALQALRDKGLIQRGQKVLINGAAGGVGTFAVQIAKSFGAEVTGVCSTRSLDLVRAIGANYVLDYTAEEFTRSAERYDMIVDCVGNHPPSALRRVMAPKGTLLAVGVRAGGMWIGPLPKLISLIVSSPFMSQRVVFFIARITAEDLTVMKDLIEANEVTPVVDTVFAWSDVPEAMRHLKSGHPRGKVVITIS